MGIQRWQLSEINLNVPQTHEVLAKALGKDRYEDMMLFDTIIGNKDRHMGNYGTLFDTKTGSLLKMTPLFDNGLSFFHFPHSDFVSSTSSQRAERYVRYRTNIALEALEAKAAQRCPFVCTPHQTGRPTA